MKRLAALLLAALFLTPLPRPAAAFHYVSPRPGAELVPRQTTIILRPVSEDVVVRVRGSLGGEYPGTKVVADDGKTLIFRPSRAFEPGESVSVEVTTAASEELHFGFDVSPKTFEPDLDALAPCELDHGPEGHEEPAQAPSIRGGGFVLPPNVPSFDVSVLDDPSPGLLFLSKNAPGIYLMIVDDAGEPEFFFDRPHDPQDFKLQNGLLTYLDRTQKPHAWRAMDDTYTLVDSWEASPGFSRLDGHDFQLLPNGHTLLHYRDAQFVDMSQIVPGGNPSAWVIGLAFQELDVSKNVVFEWRSWDHFQITDALHIDLTGPVLDYVHCNALERDTDGHYIISCRNMGEITKIDSQTGDLIWRMGGANNEFTLVGDDEWYTRQHSSRRTSTGTLTVFDNGNYSTPQESRAVEYELDEVAKIATMVWEFRNTPPLYGSTLGNAQRLPNGNTLISWGSLGIISEVRPDGTKAFEMSFTNPSLKTYRAFRFPWNGVAAAPYLWAEEPTASVALHFTKFGDPDVARYNVYRGAAPEPTTLVGSTTGNSFAIDDVSGGEVLYVRVTAEDSQMNESIFSNELELTIPASVSAPDFPTDASGLLLHQNLPNPFRLATSIRFVHPGTGPAELEIFGVRGNLVRTLVKGLREAGLVEVTWDGRDLRGREASPGVYFYRLKVGDESVTRPMTRLR